MAFKRYIKRHGKVLGPYYYENVRSDDGKIKTVYVGTNPEQHPKHKLRKGLFFVIVVLALILVFGSLLFFLQNKGYLINKVTLQEPDFEIDQILLKVLIRSNEFIEKQIRVMNTGDEIVNIEINAAGLDILSIDSNSFAIKPGQTKIVTLTFSSFIKEQNIEQQPGIYVGKLAVNSGKAAKEIPIIVEIETKNVLFDMNLNPMAIERKVNQGSDATIEVRLFNLESIESINVDVEYFVKDMNGNTVLTESETVVAKTQASFFKTISVPKNLKPGPYVFAAKAVFGSSVGTASYLFEVVGPEPEAFTDFCKKSVLCLGLSLTTLLLLFALTAYFYFFIGAYLYEKFTGIITLPRRKEEELEEAAEKPGILDNATARIGEWKEERGRKRAEREKLREEEELRKQAEKRKAQLEADRRQIWEEKRERQELKVQEMLRRRLELEKLREEARKRKEELKRELKRQKELERQRAEEERQKRLLRLEQKEPPAENAEEAQKPSDKFGKFSKILDDLKQSIEKDIQKAKKIYLKARNLYIELESEEKQKVYSELNSLYNKMVQLAREEELGRERLLNEKKEKFNALLHKIGLYKTPEEKRQAAEQKEKKMQEKEKRKQEYLIKKEELKRQKGLEARQKEEEKRKLEEENIRRKEEHKIQKELERQKKQQEAKPEEADAEKHEKESKWLGLFGKRKAEAELKETEQKPEKEEISTEKPAFFGALFKKEESGEKEKIEQKPKESEKGWFGSLFKKETAELKSKKIEKPDKTAEKKPSVFARILRKTESGEKKEPEIQKKPKTDIEELEESIRNLGLFKKIEKEKLVYEERREDAKDLKENHVSLKLPAKKQKPVKKAPSKPAKLQKRIGKLKNK